MATSSFIQRHQNAVFQGFAGSSSSYVGCVLAKPACHYRIQSLYRRHHTGSTVFCTQYARNDRN
ncbi:hypothetical protein [Dietzia sp. 2505]|uniref:hypothetical protein n=1 Tax=Dietzia sp. 2505 TaxID=3156457 RepID=UPI00339AB26A